MNKFKVIKAIKKLQSNDCVIIKVKSYDTNYLPQIRSLNELLNDCKIHHFFYQEGENIYDLDIGTIDDMIKFYESRIKELKKAKDVLELEKELKEEGIK